ncbi:hypothetical protein H2202_009710 [Exophiala xenobiotica]|nr:hypothetical protein H2202_009710 [Exophiala xenobiotica]KAK5203700.1 hypothetical protein LTR41_010580 [Exophiala xenobiotica]KAK5227851.1 hypothetical protein LTR47_008422 [Exophiala xenobiotica]KAK5253426.1 hypothetical protein LTS06_002137 [Exophiala xenobiotica]KAK5346670.1 hypothetical protein LTR61_009618 [Exophiala xenobiotica]
MSFPSRKRAPQRQIFPVAAILLLLLFTWWRFSPQTYSTEASQPRNEPFDPFSKSSRTQNNAYSQTMVVASITREDTSWILRELSDINHAIYIADDPTARLHPVANKGRESMVYLTYIIDHYHNLSDTTIFTHSTQDAWHNNDLFDFDLSRMVRAVSNEHVHRVGFFNLRCHHESGCPDHIQLFAKDHHDKIEEGVFAEVWADLHGPDVPIPPVLAAACCSQFAVSRERLQSIPLARWEKYRQWLLDTPLTDEISGRIWEFTWHYILTGEPVVCPRVDHCYCDGYGICFEGEGELMSWLVMKEVEMLAKETQKEFKERGKDTGTIDYRLWQRIQRPALKWLYKASVRGMDPRTRAVLSGRGDEWRKGDGY